MLLWPEQEPVLVLVKKVADLSPAELEHWMSVCQHCPLCLTALPGTVQTSGYPQMPFGAEEGEAAHQPMSDEAKWVVKPRAAWPPG